VAVDSNGAVHYAFAFNGPWVSERVVDEWQPSDPDPTALLGEGGAGIAFVAFRVRLATGATPSGQVLYLAYAASNSFVGPPAPIVYRGRLGTKSGTQWIFEELPAPPETVVADGTGAPLVLLDGNVILTRNGPSSWTSVSTASLGDETVDIAVGPDGAWYALTNTNAGELRASRRDATGKWVTEVVAPSGAKGGFITVTAGSVHVAYEGTGSLFYARRDGTTWSRHRVSSQGPMQYSMAVDSCGSPHFSVWRSSPLTLFEDAYIRWTPEGFRSTVLAEGCAFGDGVDIAFTPTAAVMSYFNCPYLLARVPLR
jgi:hypothetical protein